MPRRNTHPNWFTEQTVEVKVYGIDRNGKAVVVVQMEYTVVVKAEILEPSRVSICYIWCDF